MFGEIEAAGAAWVTENYNVLWMITDRVSPIGNGYKPDIQVLTGEIRGKRRIVEIEIKKSLHDLQGDERKSHLSEWDENRSLAPWRFYYLLPSELIHLASQLPGWAGVLQYAAGKVQEVIPPDNNDVSAHKTDAKMLEAGSRIQSKQMTKMLEAISAEKLLSAGRIGLGIASPGTSTTELEEINKNSEYLTVEAVAAKMNVDYAVVIRWIRSGKLPAFMVVNFVRIHKGYLEHPDNNAALYRDRWMLAKTENITKPRFQSEIGIGDAIKAMNLSKDKIMEWVHVGSLMPAYFDRNGKPVFKRQDIFDLKWAEIQQQPEMTR